MYGAVFEAPMRFIREGVIGSDDEVSALADPRPPVAEKPNEGQADLLRGVAHDIYTITKDAMLPLDGCSLVMRLSDLLFLGMEDCERLFGMPVVPWQGLGRGDAALEFEGITYQLYR